MKMFDLRLCLFVYVNLFLSAKSSIPIEKLCANSKCTEAISKAQGSVNYASADRNVLSFRPGKEIIITSKSKNKDDYWGAIIDGRVGYVPSNLIKEIHVFHSTDKLIPVSAEGISAEAEIGNKNNLSQNKIENPLGKSHSPSSLPESLSNKSSEAKSYKVVEGTTVYVVGTDEITPSPTLNTNANPQTAAPLAVGLHSQKEGRTEEQSKSTIPPEVVKLNENFVEKRDLSNQMNVTIESKENDDENAEIEEDVDDEDDEEVDDIGDDEEELEDEYVMVDNLSEKEEVKDVKNEKSAKNPTSGGMVEETMESSLVNQNTPENPQMVYSLKAGSEVVDNKIETVSVANDDEKPVTSEVSSSAGSSSQKENTQEKVKGGKQFDMTPPIILEENVEIPSQINQGELGWNKNIVSEAITNTFEQFPSAPDDDRKVPPQGLTETYGTTLNPKQNIPQHILKDTVEVPPDTLLQNPEKQAPETATLLTIQEKVETIAEVPYTMDAPAQNSEKELPETITSQMIKEDTKVTIPNTTPSFQEEIHVTETVTDKIEQVKRKLPEVVEELKPISDIVGETPEEVIEQTETNSEGPGLFSQVAEAFSGWFSSSNGELLERKDFNDENASPKMGDVGIVEEKVKIEDVIDNSIIPSGTCQNSPLEPDCKDFTEEQENQPSFWDSWFPSSVNFNSMSSSSNTFFFLVITAVTVLLFTLGHNFIEKKGKTGPLIAKINKLEQELLVSSKECILLKDEIQNFKDKIILYESSANDELVLSLQSELEESKKARVELESSIEVLQQELDAATEAGLDLNKMLSEVLTQKGGSESLLESVESLQAQLDSQQKVIDEMTKKLGVKNEENEALQTALELAKEKVENLEEELNDIKQNLNRHLKEKEDVTQDLSSQISQLQIRINQLNESKEKEISKLKKSIEEFQKKFKGKSEALTVKEEEFKALKESVKTLKTKGNANLENVFDVCRVKGELVKEEKENKILQEKLGKEESNKKILEDQVKSLNLEVEELKKKSEDAQQKKDEAEKKLEVLSTYFKEKETQLQKELGLQEALWAQKKGDEKAVYNMMKSLQEEVDSYKSQNETLKKEILDQERGLKNQIATLEQKAHENWVAARQAERKLDESRQETAQLRNRLTLIEKNVGNDVEGKANHRTEELNGVEATSPILHDTSSPLLFPPLPLDPNSSTLLPPGFMPHPMFMPPPIGGFIPPPPFLPGDRRPPPLGRMSSPPLNNRFSPPPPPDYSYERMSSPPRSPPTRSYRSPNEADRDREHFRHRTPPYTPMHPRNWDDSQEMPGFIPISSQRDSRREHKGSNVSSGHSSSDSLEKSSRLGGRV